MYDKNHYNKKKRGLLKTIGFSRGGRLGDVSWSYFEQ